MFVGLYKNSMNSISSHFITTLTGYTLFYFYFLKIYVHYISLSITYAL